MSNTTYEQKKQEAIEWMKLLGVSKRVIDRFETTGIVMGCDYSFSELTLEELEEIHNIEAERDILVYLVVKRNSIFGNLDALLYVGDYPDEWEFERACMKDGYPVAYVLNRDFPDCSEMGEIFVKRNEFGGLTRIG